MSVPSTTRAIATKAEGLVYAPADPVPATCQDVRDKIWFGVWPGPWDTARVFDASRSVYLATHDRTRIVWETAIADVISVPFECTDAFLELVSRRWGHALSQVHGVSPSPGWGVAWRAEPIRRIDGRAPRSAGRVPGWLLTEDLHRAWRRVLGLRDNRGVEPNACRSELHHAHGGSANEEIE